jgi:cytochrome b subunit of formate dehydrogenase
VDGVRARGLGRRVAGRAAAGRHRGQPPRAARDVEAFDADDRAWFRDRSTTAGRLNAGQKLNTAATAAFALPFTVTAVLLWLGERDTRFRFANTLLIHDWLMYVSVLLFAGHLYLSLVNRRRGTR